MSRKKISKQGLCWRCKKQRSLYQLVTFSDRILWVCNSCKGILFKMNKERQEKSDREERARDWIEQRQFIGKLPRPFYEEKL